MNGPSRDFLTTEMVNILIAGVAGNHVNAGTSWAVEKVERPSPAEATVWYVVGLHPTDYRDRGPDLRPRIKVFVAVEMP